MAMSLALRHASAVLSKWASYITNQQKEIANLVATECGKPIGDASLEVSIAVDHIAWAAKHAQANNEQAS